MKKRACSRLKKVADRMSRLISFFSVKREIGVDYPAFLNEITAINWFRLKIFGMLSIVIFAVVLSRMTFYSHARDFLNRKLINEQKRKTDALFRWGGEEFVILSRETTLSGMIILAEELRRSISDCAVENVHGITASFGVTEYLAGESIEETLQRADSALYAAKQNGRNRIEFKHNTG